MDAVGEAFAKRASQVSVVGVLGTYAFVEDVHCRVICGVINYSKQVMRNLLKIG